ncbi:unnamed protein product [Linum trigynum]|uniref:Uncharacterized protein n=1 Tax=Linum trigynum TaxID=586398 RepID=A0AAV2FSM5_9ROSI
MEENRNEGKSVQSQLWVKRPLGFNFMSLRMPQKEDFLPELPARTSPVLFPQNRAPCYGALTMKEEEEEECGNTRSAHNFFKRMGERLRFKRKLYRGLKLIERLQRLAFKNSPMFPQNRAKERTDWSGHWGVHRDSPPMPRNSFRPWEHY